MKGKIDSIEEQFKKEAECFDKIVKERKANNQIPDLRAEFENEYFYNNIWRNSIFLRTEVSPLCRWVIGSLKKAKAHSVIELGCGNGWFSLELARNGFDVTGLDISKESINVAQGYLDNLRGEQKLSLQYIYKNILDYLNYGEYSGESVVCVGFLHHLPKLILKNVIKRLSQRMGKKHLLLAIEPSYDCTSYAIAILVYALRLALPNHFKYKNLNTDAPRHIKNIFNELSERDRTQSVMDNSSPSKLIVKTIRDNFGEVEVNYSTAFFDKVIGSIRVLSEDIKTLSNLLKELDDIIVKYNHSLSRIVMIKAKN
jgi:2-polyprenyl-3-methyl-5-hydroxy-6-metoxy-1,4-benzoquinol methylase